MVRSRILPVLLISAFGTFSFAQKKPLDPATYDTWKSLRGVSLSNNGKWLMYTVAPQEGDVTVEVKATDGSKSYTIERGSNVQFSEDDKFVVATIAPKFEETRKARRAKAKPEDMPKSGLLILSLDNGQKFELEKITNYTIATHDTGWILYKPEPPKPVAPVKPAESKPAETKSGETKPTEQKPAEQKPEEKKGPKPDHKAGDPYVLRNLASGEEVKLENVTSTRWSKNGDVLAYTVSTADGAGDGVVWYDIKKKEPKTVFTGLGKYSKLAISDNSNALAWVTNRDDYQAKKPSAAVYMFNAKNGKVELVAKDGTKGLPDQWVVSESGSFQFSEQGSRLTFATVPKPEEEKKDDTPDDEKVNVDIWNWQDPQMMPQQILQAAAERNRTFDAVYNVNGGNVVQLETPTMKSVTLSMDGDGPIALARSDENYQKESSWQETRTDYYVVDPRTGKSNKIAENFAGFLSVSPSAKFIFGYDEAAKELVTIDPKTGKRTVIGKDIPNPIWNEETDTPSMPNAYGSAGWTKDDNRVLIYDKYDLWSVDPSGREKSVCLTGGTGRSAKVSLRVNNLDREAKYVDLSKPLMFTGQNEMSKADNVYLLSNGSMTCLMSVDKAVGAIQKAEGSDVYAFQQMDYNEPNDVWLADANLTNRRKISDINPQQKDYNWVTAELVSWMSNDGEMLQGILYKPEDFNPSKKYPMIAYFYEKSSDTLHNYFSPAPSASTINISMCCSNGYLVFVPDIPYKVGYPGESAVSAIVPGVQAMVAKGFVDPKRLGIQGQSWGGYQVGYLVTETNMFKAACAGAPVSNMVSAYGGIRWGSGVTREGQYEHGQSRIGGSLWENPLRYIENSPIFYADKIQTPLLIMSNDKDGAVPWYQGIEYFSALRRLNKPAWLVVYNEEDHNLVQRKNRKDWSIRMQQFFDHYLKDAPMPVWMSQGVPATLKGKSYGFEIPPAKKG